MFLLIGAGCRPKADVPDGWEDDTATQSRSVVETSPYSDSEVASIEPIDDMGLKALLDDTDEPSHWKSIRIEKGEITDAGVALIVEHSPSIQQLVLRRSAISDTGAASIAKLTELRIVNLPHCLLTDEGIAMLVELPKLEFVRLGSPKITDRSLELLRECKSLKFLHLIDAPISDAGLKSLYGWDQLESLYLDGSKVTAQGVTVLVNRCPELHLHLDQKHHDSDPRLGHE